MEARMQMTSVSAGFAALGAIAILGTNAPATQAQASSGGGGTSFGAFGAVSMPLGDYSDEVKTGTTSISRVT
jgi:hypothetical protein